MSNSNSLTLERIEEDLARIIRKDKASWVELYRLMQQVQDNELWRAGGHRSFTMWVTALAKRNGIHISLLWKRKNAGAIYAGYQERAAEKGKETVEMESLKVSPDNFELVKRISQGNLVEQDKLIDKVVNQELTRKDLKSTWNTVQALKNSQGNEAARKNHHTKLNDTRIDATQVAISLNEKNWLQQVFGPLYATSTSRSRRIFNSLAEVPVYTGSSRHSRRIDLLILENMTHKEHFKINLHGIEIKVSSSDLKNDHKMSEYTDFVDFFWLAVTEELLEIARDYILEEWGLLVIDSNNEVKVYQEPLRLNPGRKVETLQTALVKVLN